jgi:hypothetical protein
LQQAGSARGGQSRKVPSPLTCLHGTTPRKHGGRVCPAHCQMATPSPPTIEPSTKSSGSLSDLAPPKLTQSTTVDAMFLPPTNNQWYCSKVNIDTAKCAMKIQHAQKSTGERRPRKRRMTGALATMVDSSCGIVGLEQIRCKESSICCVKCSILTHFSYCARASARLVMRGRYDDARCS